MESLEYDHALHLVTIPGFGLKGVVQFVRALEKKLNNEAGIRVAANRIIPGATLDSSSFSSLWDSRRMFWHPERICEDIDSRIGDINGDEKLVLMGNSYGGLLALRVALRRKLRGFLKIILLDAPLRPDVAVYPSSNIFQGLFNSHYRSREAFASTCVDLLRDCDTKSIMSIGIQNDATVPDSAKWLPDLRFTEMKSQNNIKDLGLEGPCDRGVNIKLHPFYRGHSLNQTKNPILVRIIVAAIRHAFNEAFSSVSTSSKSHSTLHQQ